MFGAIKQFDEREKEERKKERKKRTHVPKQLARRWRGDAAILPGVGGKFHHQQAARPDWPSLVVCITTSTYKRFILSSLAASVFAGPDVLVRQKKKTMHHQRTIITRPFRKSRARTPPDAREVLAITMAIIIYISV